MMIKKSYDVGDTVWIYGIDLQNIKPRKGIVIKKFVMDYQGYNDENYYVIAIPTEIEDLLEIRTWHTISQDEHGPIGAFREVAKDIHASRKILARAGMIMDINNNHDEDEDDIDPDIIHAAIAKSQQVAAVPPLNLKPEKPKRRYYKKKNKA